MLDTYGLFCHPSKFKQSKAEQVASTYTTTAKNSFFFQNIQEKSWSSYEKQITTMEMCSCSDSG